MNTAILPRPWYREPWPWLLMSGPLIVVIAGLYTVWLAVSTNDGLVTEDYYKKGLVANQTITRSEQAARWGLLANVRVIENTLTVRLQSASTAFAPPATLAITIAHPTRPGLDQSKILVRTGDSYSCPIQLPAAGHWLLLLEDERKTWRLMGNVILPSNGEIQIGGAAQPVPLAGSRNQ